MPPTHISAKRQLVQAILIAAALLLPFATIAGNPVLRMDIGQRTLFMAGIAVRVDQFYLLLLATLFVTALFLLLTVILGRVWCGWLCPQTIFNDLHELVAKHAKKQLPSPVARCIGHLAALLISALISFNLFCWFIPPVSVAERLVQVSTHPVFFTFFICITLFGYLNLTLVKRSFCRSYCPYGRFQTALMDTGTLNLAFLQETRERCLRCGACVRTCPMKIDIREGFQIECINCGRCIDACRDVMAKRPERAGLIAYRFGEIQGDRVKFGSKTIALFTLTMLLGTALCWGLIGRSQAAFAVQRVAAVEPRRTPDGFQMQPWRATIGNRSEQPKKFSIRVSPDEAAGVTLLGPVGEISIPGNEHTEVTFVIRHKISGTNSALLNLQLNEGNKAVATIKIRP